jgi:ABC-2 type transport system permease protein
MKTTFRIAKLELSTLFYSPIAWFLLVIFLFQCGLAYTGALEALLTRQELGGPYLRFLRFLTSAVFTGQTGLFLGMTGKLYLFIPLLTMGLMSRETSSGTIKLLYSSPIDVSDIILGKFLAMMIYSLLLILILAVFAIFGTFNIQSADTGLLLSGLLGLYLLLCAYSAIGLFMSSLTTYQVVAALSTLVTFAVLYYIGTVWQGVDFVRDLTYFLSLSGRTQVMIIGLITTKDILYFVVIVSMFLCFSILKLKGDRQTTALPVRAARYALVVVSALAIGYVTSRPGLVGYLDTTATKINTLTTGAQQTLKEMQEGPLEVTSYINLLDGRFYYGTPDKRNEDMDRWEPYLRFKPDIHFKYVYYYDNVPYLVKNNPGMTLNALAEKYARTYKMDLSEFLTPAQIRKVINLEPEENRYVMQLRYKGKTTFLRLYDDQMVFPSETETSAALKRLTTRLPTIAFLQGELEPRPDKIGDKDYKFLTSQIGFRNALINQGFDVETISLRTGDIPGDIAALVVADPRAPFDTATLAKLNGYIARGGSLLVAGEPGKQAILDPILRPLGVRIKEGMLVQQNGEYAPDLLFPHLTPAAAAFSRSMQNAFADSTAVSMPGVAALSYNSGGAFAVQPLLLTDPKTSWITHKKIDPEAPVFPGSAGPGIVRAPGLNTPGLPAPGSRSLTDSVFFSAADGDESGAQATALALTRTINGKQQRIIVTGDADFMSNAELKRMGRTANFGFNTALFGWFTYGAFPIDSSRPPAPDTRLRLSASGLSVLKWLFMGILPAILLVSAAVLLLRRKRK